mmetsp:Transcript_65013/g.125522  ORF Transcript_65013/g.125522 Transcript_65013/m.125522 type:complete len:116 (-) Transcript_65013:995-1342(-)
MHLRGTGQRLANFQRFVSGSLLGAELARKQTLFLPCKDAWWLCMLDKQLRRGDPILKVPASAGTSHRQRPVFRHRGLVQQLFQGGKSVLHARSSAVDCCTCASNVRIAQCFATVS